MKKMKYLSIGNFEKEVNIKDHALKQQANVC